MKFFLPLLFILPTIIYAQNTNNKSLTFNKKYYECEDKWVAFPTKNDEDKSYTFGFIYLDEEAGFTLNLQSNFIIDEDGKFIASSSDSTSNIKVRLAPNTKLVAIIPNEKLAELKLPIEPEWLHFYKSDEGSVKSLVNRGYHYNHVGASQIAIENLEKAYEIEPDYSGLAFELAYAYNATERYAKALPVVENAIKNGSDNFFIYRELGFALIRLDRIDEAEKAYEVGIEKSDDKYQKSEMGINMAQAYFEIGDKKKFKKWAKLTKKYAEKDSNFVKYIKYWEDNL